MKKQDQMEVSWLKDKEWPFNDYDFLCKKFQITNRSEEFKHKFLNAWFQIEGAGIATYHCNLGLAAPKRETQKVIDSIGSALGIKLNTMKQRAAFSIICLNSWLYAHAGIIVSKEKKEYSSNSPYNPHKISCEAMCTTVLPPYNWSTE
jgi:hypothetical protein